MALFIVPPFLMIALIVVVERGMLRAISKRDWLSVSVLFGLTLVLWSLRTPDYERYDWLFWILFVIGPSFLAGLAGFLLQRGLSGPKLSVPLVIGGFVSFLSACWLYILITSIGAMGGVFAFITAPAVCAVALVSAVWLLISLPRRRKLLALLVAVGFPLSLAFGIQAGDSMSPERITERNGAQIIDALNQYCSIEGSYPRSLSDLVPDYLPDVPEALTTQRTGWMYTQDEYEFTLGYWRWPEKMGADVCLFRSNEPAWECKLNNWGPFPGVATPSH